MDNGQYVVEIIIGGLGTIAMLFFGYIINGIRKSIETAVADFKEIERRVSKLEAAREESLAFRHSIEIMFQRVQEQHSALMRELADIKDWVKKKDQDILEFYKRLGDKMEGS